MRFRAGLFGVGNFGENARSGFAVRYDMKEIPLLIVAVLAAALCGCAKEQKKDSLIPPTPALLTPAVSKDVYAYIATSGTTAAFESVSIVPQVSGQIVKINFKQGDFVKAGQILAEIDKRPYRAAVMQAEGNLRQALAQLKIDELEVERNRKLAKNNYVDKQTFDSYVAKVEADKGTVEALKGALETAKINLDWCDLRAPVDGKVGLYNINVGNVVTANSSAITTIEYADKLYVDFVIPSQRLYDALGLMKERGGMLDITVSYIEDDMASERFRKAKVNIVLNRIRYETGTAVLRGELDNADHLFWPDQPVKVVVDMAKLNSAVLVPDECVQMNQAGEFVYVATPYKGGVYVMRQQPVESGQLYPGQLRLVKGGVKSGELVALRVSDLRLQAGPFVYRADAGGRIMDAEGKPIVDPELMRKFMYEASTIAGELRAEYMKKAAQSAAKADAVQAQVRAATRSVNSGAASGAPSGAGAQK